MFERKRGMKTISEQETEAVLAMAEAIKALTQQLDDAVRNLRIANERVAQLEAQLYNGTTK